VDLASGTNTPGLPGNFANQQVVRCVRVNLTDPNVQLFTTPQATPAGSWAVNSRETLTLSVPDFLTKYKVQIAVDSNFYEAEPGTSQATADPTSEGLPCEVYGVQVCEGTVVSPSDSEGEPRYCSLLFSTNKTPFFCFNNTPPGTNLAGMYTVATGVYPLVSNGVDISYAMSNAYYNVDQSIHGVQPRTCYGVSQNNQYLYLMTIDGRQSGYSDGAYDTETSYWIRQFGAWNAVMMDGGGSTALYMASSTGAAVGLNHSSYLPSYGRERYIGSHFGVFANPLPGFFTNVVVNADDTAAVISWTTVDPATTLANYGLTASLGLKAGSNSTLTATHAVLLTNLTPATSYYYDLVGTIGTNVYVSSNLLFTTTNYVTTNSLFDFPNPWSYASEDLDGVPWTKPGYNSAAWDGSGPGVLWADAYGTPGNLPLAGTTLPLDPNSGYPFITYYFLTGFDFTNAVAGVTLIAEDYLDAGAVFYLNGTEIYRLRMPAGVIANATLASTYPPCEAQGTFCPDNWTVAGALVATNLVVGNNVLAVEAHNNSAAHHAVNFGLSLSALVPYAANPTLTLSYSHPALTLGWGRAGFILQQAGSPTGPWTNAPGASFLSPYTVTNTASGSLFYRLKR